MYSDCNILARTLRGRIQVGGAAANRSLPNASVLLGRFEFSDLELNGCFDLKVVRHETSPRRPNRRSGVEV